MNSYFSTLFIFLSLFQFLCKSTAPTKQETPAPQIEKIENAPRLTVGAARFDQYLETIKSKKIALVVNQTTTIGQTHLLDTLIRLGVPVEKIFAPEHGFRGVADAGETILDGKDAKTGVPIVSIYGDNKKPKPEHLKGLDLVIFDIQDIGARLYTYISTLHYIMEACAENNIPVLILDRPNPNGHYVDGPILQKSHTSFVGMHPIPIVHGMTIGEYAKMINGEGWLKDKKTCSLSVVSCANYTHDSIYILPIKPSPNIPNNRAIYLYPSICFFEGTVASLGRGTNTQFQVYGHPDFKKGDYTFTPVSMEGAKTPPLQDKLCRGYDLTKVDLAEIRNYKGVNLKYVIDFYRDFPDKGNFFLKNLYFDKLAGSEQLRKQIIQGLSEAEIKASWKAGLEEFKAVRSKYLLYL